MGAIAQARGVLFYVMALEPILWADTSRIHVPAGAVGMAVIRWGGRDPGYVVEWDGHGVASVLARERGVRWVQVDGQQMVNAEC